MTKKHLERVKAEAETDRRRARKINRGSILVIAMLLAGMAYFISDGHSPLRQPVTAHDAAPAGSEAADFAADPSQLPPAVWAPPMDHSESVDLSGTDPDADDWNLLLVSVQTPLPEDFTVDLETVSGGKVDTRIAEALRQMTADAKGDGVQLLICSAYRNVKEQSVLYEKKLAYYRALGYDETQCANRAGRFVQPPGASEHHTGLAVDFWNGVSGELSDAYARTDAYFWLKEHAAQYGFIERYPADKEEVTGIAWEPWHFRYVGPSHAAAISAGGLCLEEYLNTMN